MAYKPTYKTKYRTAYGPVRKSKADTGLDFAALAQQAGVEEAKPKGPGVLERIGGFLSAGETGEFVYQMATGKDFGEATKTATEYGFKGLAGKGYGEKHTYADVLREMGVQGEGLGSKLVRGVGGTLLDIGLDPTTYLSFGVGAVAKIGGKSVTKEGVEQLSKLTARGLTREAAEKVVLETPEFIAKKGIRIAGQYVGEGAGVVGKAVRAYTEPISLAGDIVKVGGEKFRPLGDLIEGVQNAVGHTFVKDYDLKKAGWENIANDINSLKGTNSITRKKSIIETVKMFMDKEGKLPSNKEFQQFFDIAGEGFGKNLSDDVWAAVNGKGWSDKLTKEVGKLPVSIQQPYTDYISGMRGQFLDLGKQLGVPEEVLAKKDYISWIQQEFEKGVGSVGGFSKVPSALKKRESWEYLGETKNPIYSISKTLSELRIAANNKSAFRGMITDLGDEAVLLSSKQAKEAGIAMRKGMNVSGDVISLFNDGKIEKWRVPQEVAGAIKNYTTSKNTNEFLKFYDDAQRVWKGSVTKYFPAFHFRNESNNILSLISAGVRDPSLLGMAYKVQTGKAGMVKTLAGEEFTFDEVRGFLTGRGIKQTGWFQGELMEDIVKEMDISKLDIQKLKAGELLEKRNVFQQFDNTISKLGGGIEDNAKIALFLDRIQKGDDVAAATQMVKKYLFDYTDLSDIEKGFFKRVVPFYTFFRKNLALQMGVLGQGDAGRNVYSAIYKTLRNTPHLMGEQPTAEESALLPDWIKDTLHIPLGKDKEGNLKYITSLGMGIEDLARLTPQDLMARVSPIIKVPIEQMTGYSFFTKEQIDESSFYIRTYPGIAQLPGFREFLRTKEEERDVYVAGKPTDEKKQVITVNPKRKHLLDAFIGRTYTTIGKTQDERKTNIDKITNALTGVKVSSVDLAEQGYWRDKKLMEQLQEQLIQMGYLKEFKTVYQPKD